MGYKFCPLCLLNKKRCSSKSLEHRRALERLNPNCRPRKNANARRYRLNPIYKASERIRGYFHRREKREATPGYIEQQRERMIRQRERRKAKEKARIEYKRKVAERAIKLEIQRLERDLLIALGKFKPREKRVDKPLELKGLNACDYPHMTVEQRKRWNQWQHEIYFERRRERQRRWRRENPEKKSAGNKRWNELNKGRLRFLHKRNRQKPKNKILCNAYRRIKQFCPDIKIESAAVLRGCSGAFFHKHIEQQFYSNMTWENYGEVWELDHIKPVCAFDLTFRAARSACANFKNLQPLLIKDNMKKGDRPGHII
jgi:hypothetical protein